MKFQTHIPADFLRDESRKGGAADAIAFPENAAELADAVREAAARNQPVTVQGARTGISAGAVPDGGVIVNLSKMDRILGLRTDAEGRAFLRAQPGVPLIALRRFLSSDDLRPTADGSSAPSSNPRPPASRFFFSPDPTETSASLGGMAACNSSGACSFAYGPTRNHISGLTVVLADGETLTLRRGRSFARGLRFSITSDGGKTYAGELPDYALPAVKNAAGYWVKPDMDLIDLFIGSEGTLGIVAELELSLTPSPHKTLGTLCYLEHEADALELVEALRRRAAEAGKANRAPLRATFSNAASDNCPRRVPTPEAGGGGLRRPGRRGSAHRPHETRTLADRVPPPGTEFH